jgi:uncharacterized protein (UPF0276 family)
MPANRFNGFTAYGMGIGLRIPHYEHIFSKKPVVDWFEIISENYMVHGGSFRLEGILREAQYEAPAGFGSDTGADE